MKWVVGSVAVLVAFVIGVAVGWAAHRAPPVAAAPVASPATSMTFAPPLPPPIASSAYVPAPSPWTEDSARFAWPKPPVDSDVVAVDATHYVVRRRFIDQAITDQAKLASEARFVPAMEDGGVAGMKLFAIRPGSTYARIGLQNGDRLDTVNGVSVARPEQMLEAYTRLRSAKRLVFVLQRKGAPLDLHYEIVDP